MTKFVCLMAQKETPLSSINKELWFSVPADVYEEVFHVKMKAGNDL